MRAVCCACFRHCALEEGSTGFCGARVNKDGQVVLKDYGLVSSLALDPVEKKPLARFYPGSMVYSVGFFGCSMACPFCQNHEIAKPEKGVRERYGAKVTPEQVVSAALSMQNRGCIGIAYTYNEPLTSWEFVRDCSKLAREAGLKNVLVTNGMASPEVLAEVFPLTDAMNIDLKAFREQTYREVLGGSLPAVQAFIEIAVRSCHVELTTLIVPGMNDSDAEMDELSRWVRTLDEGKGEIPLHVTRFFPRYQMTDREATSVRRVRELAKRAGQNLRHVYVGNC